MATLSIQLPDDWERKLDEEARRADRKRADLVCDAITEYLNRKARKRSMAAMEAAARSLAQDEATRREALEIAQEFLLLDDEALDFLDGHTPDEPGAKAFSEKWWT